MGGWRGRHVHAGDALHEVVPLHAARNFEVQALLEQVGCFVEKLSVNADAVAEGAVQALEGQHVSLQTGEEIAHFFVAAGTGLREVAAAHA
jgi:hypothetical protein